MAEWYCFKCKEKLEEAELKLIYEEVEGKQVGLRCPKCGASYIEESAIDEMAKTEKMIEEK